MNTPGKVERFRGCFIGGPLDGQDLPAHVQAGGVAMCRVVVDGELQEVRYLHRRAAERVGDDLVRDVEFLVFDGLTDEEVGALVDQHRIARDGWGTPVLTLPASGFRYVIEGHVVRDFDECLQRTEGLRLGIVTRLSPEGACIAAGQTDVSRPLSREEMDPTRCGWCDSGIGHTIDEHRKRVELTIAEERAAEFRRDLDDQEIAELPLAVAQVLHGPPAEVIALAMLQEDMQRRVIAAAGAEFFARRRAEAEEAARPALILP